jgi:predicted small metal-binding protein
LCRDVGLDCEGAIQGQNDDEVMQKAAAHVSEVQPDFDLSPDGQQRLKGLIHDA